MPHDPISLANNGLYMLLSDLGSERQFHWGLYLAITPTEGQIYHMINSEKTGHEWKYDEHPSTGVPKSTTLIVAVKIADMDPALHKSLAEKLETVSQELPITCRVWIKRALKDLDDAGFIKLVGKIDEIALEAELLAAENRARRRRTVESCEYSLA